VAPSPPARIRSGRNFRLDGYSRIVKVMFWLEETATTG
jgi:hypothetical protein